MAGERSRPQRGKCGSREPLADDGPAGPGRTDRDPLGLYLDLGFLTQRRL